MPSTVQLFSQAISQFKTLQGQLVEKQGKIGADSKAETFAELGNDISIVQSYKLSIARSERYINAIKDAQRKNDVQYQAIQQLLDTATSFKADLTQENSAASGPENNITARGNAALDNIRGALNLRDGANYIFAGSKTNIEPVGSIVLNNNLISGEPTANYYSGDNFKATLDVSNSLTVEYGLTAADPAFQKLIGAINAAKDAEAGGNQDYELAGDLLDEAINELITLQAKIGDNSKLFESSTDYHSKVKATFEDKYGEINAPDIIQLTIETTQIQATLEASFSAFSKISQLSLINFL